MILGYGIIAVPTGIYSLELVKSYNANTIRNDVCPSCGETGHDSDAEFCKFSEIHWRIITHNAKIKST